MVATVDLRQRLRFLAVAVSGLAREKEKNVEEGRGRMERAGENMAQVRLSCTWGEVATGADTGGHAARPFCTVGQFKNYEGTAILPQTYH